MPFEIDIDENKIHVMILKNYRRYLAVVVGFQVDPFFVEFLQSVPQCPDNIALTFLYTLANHHLDSSKELK